MKIKKAKGANKCVMKRKHKIRNCKSCLGATQVENKTNYLEKNEIDTYSIKKIIMNS